MSIKLLQSPNNKTVYFKEVVTEKINGTSGSEIKETNENGQVLTITDVLTGTVAYQDLPSTPSSTKEYFSGYCNVFLPTGTINDLSPAYPDVMFGTNDDGIFSLFDLSYATFVTEGNSPFSFVSSTNGSGFPGQQLQYDGTETKKFKVHFDSCLAITDASAETFNVFCFTSDASPYFHPIYPNPPPIISTTVTGYNAMSFACTFHSTVSQPNNLMTDFIIELNQNDYLNLAVDSYTAGGVRGVKVSSLKFVITEL
jgi:hypothetical protein